MRAIFGFLLLFSLNSVAAPIDGSAALKKNQIQHGASPKVGATTSTVPYWSDSFTYQGLSFPYRMVGTHPKQGSRTTIVPTVIIPIRYEFPDGQVFDASVDQFDGQTPVQGILNSPIFQNYPFIINGTSVGNTQYGDAVMRANFWNYVSTVSPNYHVLLQQQPTVTATQTIVVPAGLGLYYTDPSSGDKVPLVNWNFIDSQEKLLRDSLSIPPNTLSIIVRGHVFVESLFQSGQIGAEGWHGVESTPTGIRTFIGTSYQGTDFLDIPDVDVLSHEVAEWLNDPFIDNYTPGWNVPFTTASPRCDSGGIASGLMEVADPVENFSQAVVTLPGTFNYHVAEVEFLDFFTRQSPSGSINGQYSMFTIGAPFGQPSVPSTDCVGSVQVATRSTIDVPGSLQTIVEGVNNSGDAVGYSVDSFNRAHGFLFKSGVLTTFDFPGARQTFAEQINNAGQIVGYSLNRFGIPHGFLYYKGKWTQIDYPGATDTQITGISAGGVITGAYDTTQPITHGFVLQNGQFSKLDSPFGQQSWVSGVSDDLTQFVGFSWTNPFTGPFIGFLLQNNQFAPIVMPLAQYTLPSDVNNNSLVSGNFQNFDGYASGFIRWSGFLHEVNVDGVNTVVTGNNSFNQIAGQTYDFTKQKWVGFVGTLPIGGH